MKIGIIGTGNMGQAIISRLEGSRLVVYDKDVSKAEKVSRDFGASVHTPENGKLEETEIIIICVKPQEMKKALGFLSEINLKSKVVISIAAGIKTADLEKGLGTVSIIRAMPNTPALLGMGITAICKGKHATEADLKKAENIFLKIGDCVVVEEKDMDAVTAVSGSGPAYVFLFAEELIKAAVKAGLPLKASELLVRKTFEGSSRMMYSSDRALSEMREQVTSKGGTTEEAIKVFHEEKLSHIIERAVHAAKRRSGELSKNI
ncbi:MAG: pyrroline-5-carboxylate reductase [Candidatus Aureabacteria bacterium]|nr:pyrroline-5-carboxylate reductase [Candidatus Auribacterota bacterium]